MSNLQFSGDERVRPLCLNPAEQAMRNDLLGKVAGYRGAADPPPDRPGKAPRPVGERGWGEGQGGGTPET